MSPRPVSTIALTLLLGLVAGSAEAVPEIKARASVSSGLRGRRAHRPGQLGRGRVETIGGEAPQQERLVSTQPWPNGLGSKWDAKLLEAVGHPQQMESARHPGASLQYELHGQGPQTLVLLNGSFYNRQQWKRAARQIASELGPGYRYLRLDYPGFAGAKGELKDIFQASDLMVELFDQLQIDRAHVLGLSLGSLVGQALLAEHGDRLRSFAGLSSPSLTNPQFVQSLSRAFAERHDALSAKLGRMRGKVDGKNQEEVVGAMLGMDGKGFWGGLARDLATGEIGSWLYGTPISSLTGLAAKMSKPSAELLARYRKALPGADPKVPVKLYVGTADRLTPPAMSEALQRIWPHASITQLERMDHGSVLYNKADLEPFAEHYARWITSLER